jgi:nucleotide-binding universal stress UspA family protein
MTQRILVPFDGSDQAITALEYALTQFSDADITVVHVIEAGGVSGMGTGYMAPHYGEAFAAEREAAEDRAEQLFEEAQAHADEYGVTLTTATESGRPVREIIGYTEENDIDQIVIGSHGRSGASRLLLGSVAETVVRRAPVPVIVVR